MNDQINYHYQTESSKVNVKFADKFKFANLWNLHGYRK